MSSKRRMDELTQRTDAELAAEDRQRRIEMRQLTEAKAIIRALQGEVDAAKARAAFLGDLADAPEPRLLNIEATSTQRRKKLPAATYVALASDWHVEERVRPETVGGRNEYNPEIARERAANFWRSNHKMLNAARSAWDIRAAIVWLGGDLITGYIHEELEEDNFLSPTQASLLAFDIIASGIRSALDSWDLERLVVPTSHGNHGRTYKKPRIATAAYNSFEWLLYQHLARHFAGEPRVEFRIANGYHNLVEVYGHVLRFHHGDAIKFAGGVGGLAVPAMRRIARQAKGDQAKVLLDCFGHHHLFGAPPGIVHNGSLIGWNAYAEQGGFDYQEPLQASFVVDERYGLVSNINPIIVKRGR